MIGQATMKLLVNSKNYLREIQVNQSQLLNKKTDCFICQNCF